MAKPLDPENFKILAKLNPVVHSPGRLAILAALEATSTAEFSLLLKQTDLTRGNLSAHLSKLETAGYVTIAKSFVDRIPCTQISLTDQGRAAFLDYRQQLQALFGVPTEEEYNSEIFRRYRERMKTLFDQPPPKQG